MIDHIFSLYLLATEKNGDRDEKRQQQTGENELWEKENRMY